MFILLRPNTEKSDSTVAVFAGTVRRNPAEYQTFLEQLQNPPQMTQEPSYLQLHVGQALI